MLIIGIDPGLKGGIAGIDYANKIAWAIEMPVKKNLKTDKSEYDIERIADLLRACKPDHICVERVHSMPGQGVSSTFLFGQGYGILLGIIGTLGIPFSLVTPRVWKSKLEITSDKNTSREKATELFPACSAMWKLKKHDGLAESILLAYYGSGMLDLDLMDPGDIFNLYQIEVNSNGRTKNSGRHHNKSTSTKDGNARKRANKRLNPSTGRSRNSRTIIPEGNPPETS